MKRRHFFGGGAATAALTLLVAVPGTADASLGFGSSMTASCVGLDCQTVRFALDPDGSGYADWASTPSGEAAVWRFGSLSGAMGDDGGSLDESDGAGAGGFDLQAAGGHSRLYIAVGMTAAAAFWATQAQWGDGDPLSYNGQGGPQVGEAGNPGFEGTVSPEPVSMVLLGTGLAGLAGVGRRRRRSRSEDAE